LETRSAQCIVLQIHPVAFCADILHRRFPEKEVMHGRMDGRTVSNDHIMVIDQQDDLFQSAMFQVLDTADDAAVLH